MQITPLSEGEFTIGFDKVFVPFNPATDVLEERPRGSLLVEVQPFLVRMQGAIILLDTGLGFEQDGVPQLHHNLRAAGLEPQDVTHVLLSHLHKDHAGGAMQQGNGLYKTALPNAQYYIHRQEAEYALEQGRPSYHPGELEPLMSSGQVAWLEGDSGSIAPGIDWEHSGGHCPWHVVYRLEDEEEAAFFGGDEAPQLRQLKIRYVAKYDYDGRKAADLRDDYAERGRRENWNFLFYHDIKKPQARLGGE